MSHSIVIFGATGDLTSRKLIPALYNLFRKKRLPPPINIVGVSRSKLSDDDWRTALATDVAKHTGDKFDANVWSEFASIVFYQYGDITNADDYNALAKRLDELESGKPSDRVFYLSTKPALYAPAFQGLGAAGLTDESNGARRLVIEKPFGTDQATARELTSELHKHFTEDQAYRIDHYLGKETVQNMMVLRFANTIFEPVWNRNYVDHVQITVAESVKVGSRAGYYDTSGVLRDMFQNHLLQLMTITAMEAPAKFEAKLVRDEKVKILQAVRPLRDEDFASDTMRGQYEGYLDEPGVPPSSQTATYAALKLHIDNWRWQGVPFYLRSGKSMSCRTTQIVIQFRETPHLIMPDAAPSSVEANRLVIQIQPNEGIQMHFQTKVPDDNMNMRLTTLDFNFHRQFKSEMPEAYERLLLDALHGDASLFARADEVELAWGLIDPIIDAWRSPAAPPLEHYANGFWGPNSGTEWMRAQGREWFDVCPVLS